MPFGGGVLARLGTCRQPVTGPGPAALERAIVVECYGVIRPLNYAGYLAHHVLHTRHQHQRECRVDAQFLGTADRETAVHHERRTRYEA